MSIARLLPLLCVPLLVGCPSKDSGDDDDDGGGDGADGGGWDLGMDSGAGTDGGTGTDTDGTDTDTDTDTDGSTDTDGTDTDTDTDTDGTVDDRDGDGWTEEDGDCDDTDADVHPGAYDRPNDGIDGDCAGGDRSFDGIVLDRGESTVVTITADVPAGGSLDIALLLDTTGSMSESLGALNAEDIVDELVGIADDVQVGYASWDDYAYGSMGSSSSGDIPFHLEMGISSDIAEVQDAIDADSLHYGGDGPESGMEALYQAAVGKGYDQDCDESFDSSTDVPPFIASSSDAFGGTKTGSYDRTTPGIGTRGGMGFRSGAKPVFVLITDNLLRDPDAGYSTPGGCLLDAGHDDVVDALNDLDAWFVGIGISSSTPMPQLTAIAEDIDSTYGSTASVDYVSDPAATLNRDIAAQIENLIDEHGLGGTIGRIRAQATDDEDDLVSRISPTSYTDVDGGDTPEVDFDITLTAPSTGSSVITTSVTVTVDGDGDVLATETWDIEIAPR